MEDVHIPSFNLLIQQSLQKHWEQDALSDYGLQTSRYKDVACTIAKLHVLYHNCGIQPGEKIALCGRNMSMWGMAFLSIITYGAVAVPILHEFHPQQIHDIVNHCDARILFVGDMVWKKLCADEMPNLMGIISLDSKELLNSRSDELAFMYANRQKLFCQQYPQKFDSTNLAYHIDNANELALINYTSGTTSNSKGVLIPYRALWSNCDFAATVMGSHFRENDQMLSMLPLAHMYGMAFEFLFEITHGIHVHFLTRTASPTILLKALADIRPRVLVMVPLILEKVVRKAILPKIQKTHIKILLKSPFVGKRLKQHICNTLTKALGNNFYEVIIGGAALNQDIERLLHNIGFPYTVGYGATECAPIICYENHQKLKLGSCGKSALHMRLEIDSSDPEHIPGEVMTSGPNVMLGYYKNEEATRQTLDSEGWYHTGDLGIIDKEGNIFIKGRIKNMLLGANGQNIYPEEIEDRLANMPFVQECVVVQKSEKLYALVYPDDEQIKAMNIPQDEIKNELEKMMEQNRQELNHQLPSYEALSGIRIVNEEFEKTPKKSIKRYLYANIEI